MIWDHRTLKLLAAAVLALVHCGSARAALPILNASFEAPDRPADGSYGTPDNWVITPASGLTAGNIEATWTQYNSPAPVTGIDGTQAATLYTWWADAGTTFRMYQDTSATFEAGVSYDLEVLLGKRSNTSAPDGTLGTLEFRLEPTGGQLVAKAEISDLAGSHTADTFQLYTSSFQFEPGMPPSAVGQAIRVVVQLRMDGQGAAGFDFDAIQIGTMTVPEPRTVGLWAGGVLLGWIAFRHGSRARKHPGGPEPSPFAIAAHVRAFQSRRLD
ncbi:MAG: hypothetical protein KDM81_17160 [Verrucomicrobiae bacterium]|nr:hypothetical protein [Verrucomicrobiae bacterium]